MKGDAHSIQGHSETESDMSTVQWEMQGRCMVPGLMWKVKGQFQYDVVMCGPFVLLCDIYSQYFFLNKNLYLIFGTL